MSLDSTYPTQHAKPASQDAQNVHQTQSALFAQLDTSSMEHHASLNAPLVPTEPMEFALLAIVPAEHAQPRELVLPAPMNLFKMDQLASQHAQMVNLTMMDIAQAAHQLAEDATHSPAANYVPQDILPTVDVLLNAQSDIMEMLVTFAVFVTQLV